MWSESVDVFADADTDADTDADQSISYIIRPARWQHNKIPTSASFCFLTSSDLYTTFQEICQYFFVIVLGLHLVSYCSSLHQVLYYEYHLTD